MIGCISERGWTANKRVNRKRPARAGLLRCLLTNHVRLSRRRLSRTSRTWCDEACGSAMYGPAVCCKGKPSQRGTFGLAPMYQTYLWSVWNAPGHHGYERAFDYRPGIIISRIDFQISIPRLDERSRCTQAK